MLSETNARKLNQFEQQMTLKAELKAKQKAKRKSEEAMRQQADFVLPYINDLLVKLYVGKSCKLSTYHVDLQIQKLLLQLNLIKIVGTSALNLTQQGEQLCHQNFASSHKLKHLQRLSRRFDIGATVLLITGFISSVFIITQAVPSQRIWIWRGITCVILLILGALCAGISSIFGYIYGCNSKLRFTDVLNHIDKHCAEPTREKCMLKHQINDIYKYRPIYW